MIRRPTIVRVRPRIYRILDVYLVPPGQDVRYLGLALLAVSFGLFLSIGINFRADPFMPFITVGLGIVGLAMVVKAPMIRRRDTLLDLDLSRGVCEVPISYTNGGGSSTHAFSVNDVDEVLFAVTDAPLSKKQPKSVLVTAFAVHIRTFDGELHAVVDASVHQDRTYRVASFLAEAFDVGIKQVGKGWRD